MLSKYILFYSLVTCVGCTGPAADTNADASLQFEDAVRAAQSNKEKDLQLVRDRFEQLLPQEKQKYEAEMDKIADRTKRGSPDRLQFRLTQASTTIQDTSIALKVASELADHAMDDGAESAIGKHRTNIQQGRSDEIDALLKRVAQRQQLAKLLNINTSTKGAAQLFSVLTSAEDIQVDGHVWKDLPQTLTTSVQGASPKVAARTPEYQCDSRKLSAPQLIGPAKPLDGYPVQRRERPEESRLSKTEKEIVYENLEEALAAYDRDVSPEVKSRATFDNTIAPLTSQSFINTYSDQIGFELVGRTRKNISLCGENGEGVSTSGVELLQTWAANAGSKGEPTQKLCVGKAAVMVVEEAERRRVFIAIPSQATTEIFRSHELGEDVSLREIRGVTGPNLLAVRDSKFERTVYAEIFDLAKKEKLFAIKGVENANVSLMKLGSKGVDSLVIQYPVEGNDDGCFKNCPQHRKLVAIEPFGDGYSITREVCSLGKVAVRQVGRTTYGEFAGDAKAKVGDFASYVRTEIRKGTTVETIAGNVANALGAISESLMSSGNFVQIESEATQALKAMKILPKAGYSDRMSKYLHFPGMVLAESKIYLQKFDEAISVAQSGLQDESVGFAPSNILDYENRISVAHLQRGSFRLALPHLKKALSLANPENLEPVLGNMAWYSLQAKDFGQATALAARAMAIGESRPINTIFFAEARAGLGFRDEAVNWLANAVKDAASSAQYPDLSAALIRAARVAETLKEPQVGLLLLDQALIFSDESTWRAEAADFAMLYGQLLRQARDTEGAQEFASIALAQSAVRPTNSLVEALLQISEYNESLGKNLEALAVGRQAFEKAIQISMSWGGEAYQLATAQFARKSAENYFYLLVKSGVSPEVVRSEISKWKGFLLRDGLAQETSPAGQSSPFKGMKTRLQSSEVYLDYFISDKIAFALVIDPQQTRMVLLPTSDSEVKSLSSTVLQQMDVRLSSVQYNVSRNRLSPILRQALQKLHEVLMTPIGMPDSTSGVYISPDGGAGTIPWAALIDRENVYLGQRLAIVVTPGEFFGSQEARCQGCASAEILGIVGRAAGTKYSDNLGIDVVLAALTHAPDEVRSIRKLWGEGALSFTDVDEKSDASGVLSWLKQHSKQLSVIHIFGHGSFNATDPTQSRLYIEPNANALPPFVTAEDIAQLKLSATDLVVLNTCESGSLESRGGGEPIGLVRAFLTSGASAVVATQWLVDDHAAQTFAEALHRSLKDNSTLYAYKSAQAATFKKFAHPYYWAVFQLHGSPMAREKRSS